MTDDYLYHHGIIGQKWGIRRFQNPDRTWTEEGKKRYGRAAQKQKAKKEYGVNHDTVGETKTEKRKLAVNVALDLITLNPIGAGMDIARVVQANKAEKKEQEAEERLSKLKTDPKTGLKLKSSETTADEDVKLVNPGFHNWNTNTKNNCVLCSTAFELRRRGYDVVAKKESVGYTPDEYIKWFKGAKHVECGAKDGKKVPPVSNMLRSIELANWAEANILSQGNGARGYLSMQITPYAGHSVAYEVKNNKLVIYDAQSGKKYNLQQIAGMSIDLGYTRVDNLQPNWAAMKAAGAI